MRRMLDPKEVGGGGDEKLYCHCINFNGSWSLEKAGSIWFNYYSKSNRAITFEELANYFIGNNLSCSGYISIASGSGRKYYTASFVSAGRNKSIAVNYIDPEANAQKYADLKKWKMSETISEVK